MNIHSRYTIALFANSTYSIVFFFIHFIICSPALGILSSNQNDSHMEQKFIRVSSLQSQVNMVPINKHKLNTSWILVK